ncbi:MAG: hypothetical protein HY301_02185 [Verrucomicrobia bacterium]|nr:hypothetical protein [Verrucomicrobiota bacterium]
MRATLVVVAVIWICGGIALAQVGMGNELVVDLTKPQEATNHASWGADCCLTNTARGLGVGDNAGTSANGWIHTKPLAVAIHNEPAQHLNLRVTIEYAPSEPSSTQRKAPFPTYVFARYSPDLKHWSTWHFIESLEKTVTFYTKFIGLDEILFQGRLVVPRSERVEFEKEYFKFTSRRKTSDQEEFVNDLIKREPKFFERSLPFIGYVEVLFEGSVKAGVPIKKLKVEASCTLSGMNFLGNDRSPWRFKAP